MNHQHIISCYCFVVQLSITVPTYLGSAGLDQTSGRTSELLTIVPLPTIVGILVSHAVSHSWSSLILGSTGATMSGRRWQTEGIEVKLDGRVEASDSTFNSYPDYNECRPVHKPHPQQTPPPPHPLSVYGPLQNPCRVRLWELSCVTSDFTRPNQKPISQFI